ncbi:UbiA-like polyprenyltransferase [Chitinophaga sancti]|uniref:4-hydroxybenzoate polyprenyltransferase n=1 Tax=Chitinophaga sancti TaxID=1004 RepID=A0A1K1PUS9_9BACT|nr:UbiA-like polyprenyltransferase [Chitinophaga sancti]WQD61602.1 UbiA-like polyprenyltransferase [Chitinophaga sancti]WQG92841.1 UbiA-like polyprenyltransferase [Chitinophaga sancti]SFW51416.1 4-hydroxybenzoate polyprenyltransferase [Chitinophaga sancti]
MITTVNKYLSLVKFSHTIFAMPFALTGFFMATAKAGYSFSWQLFVLVVLCMVFARSAAMAFNRWLDVDIDKINPRTAKREIPAGVITKKNALLFIIINCAAFITTTWFINMICFVLSPVALIVVLGYSYTKRFTALCHMVLGLGLSLAPIGAYLSVTGHFAALPILLSCLVLCWVSGFDIIYSLQDEDFDRSQALNSVPAWLGKAGALHFSEGLHVVAGALAITIGLMGQFHWLYAIGAAVFIIMLISQHLLVKPNDLSKVNIAFMTTNGIASVVFAIFAIADMLFLA